MENTLEKKILSKVEKELGFSIVMDELINAKKPLIGHNMIYDMMFFYNHFITDLPSTYNEFAEEVSIHSFIINSGTQDSQ